MYHRPTPTMTEEWELRFLALAGQIASWSKDPSTKVGAVIVREDRTIASVGYNGFPRGVKDTPAVYADRPQKLLRTVHAEMNAILSAREPLEHCYLFVSPLFPCATCAGAIVQSGIQRVVARMGTLPEAWQDSFAATREMFDQSGVDYSIYPLAV